MAEDYVYQTNRASGGNINIQEAPSEGTQFLNSFVQGLTSTAVKSQEKKQKDEIEKANFYATLRKSGYSKEEAIDKVDKVYSGGFLEKVLGKSQAFTAPSSDSYDLETKKTTVGIAKDEAEIGLTKAKESYYKSGGPNRTVIDKMTPNQLQQRLKYLSESFNSDDPDVKEEIDTITTKIRSLTMKTAEPSPSQAAGSVIKRKTKDGKIAKFDANTKQFLGYE